MKKTTCALVAATAIASAANAATVYHISFGDFDSGLAGTTVTTETFTGVDVDGIAGDDTLNRIGTSFNPVTALNSTGVDDGVVVQIGGYGGFNDSDATGNGSAFGSQYDSVLSTLTFGGAAHTITVANLDPTKQYKVEWFSGLTTSINNNIAVNGGIAVNYNTASNHTNGTIITFDNVATGTFQDEFGTDRLNAIQLTSDGGNPVSQYVVITTIPEPSSTALLGLGGLALILRRRK